jgi:hypothetical protein
LNQPAIPADPPCAVQSFEAAESLAGTAAPSVKQWLLIECRGRWAPKIRDTEALPSQLRQALGTIEEQLPQVRPMLIRRPKTDGQTCHRIAVVSPRDKEGTWEVKRENLASVNASALVQVLAGKAAPPEDAAPLTRPLWLVCTHGRRDRCCARLGVPFWDAMNQVTEADVWQCSHLGGHRFAATAVHLPSGLCYGRLEPSEARALTMAHAQGEVYRLDRLRGRTNLSRPAQAAEILLRERLGAMHLNAFQHQETTERPNGGWTVHFTDTAGRVHTVHVHKPTPGPTIQPSCAKPKMAPVMNLQGLTE